MNLKFRWIALVLLLVPSTLAAQDVDGMWDITAAFSFASETETVGKPNCEYSGKGVMLSQSGSAVSGTVNLNLITQPVGECPGEIISGELVATLSGSAFSGTLSGGKLLGTAKVSGSIAGATTRAASAGTTLTGTASVGDGSFAGASGTFAGQLAPIAPTLGGVGITILALILFGGSVLLLTRRDRVEV